MTAGVNVPFDVALIEDLYDALPRRLGKLRLIDLIDDRRFAETIYRVALADGIMDRVTYQDPARRRFLIAAAKPLSRSLHTKGLRRQTYAYLWRNCHANPIGLLAEQFGSSKSDMPSHAVVSLWLVGQLQRNHGLSRDHFRVTANRCKTSSLRLANCLAGVTDRSNSFARDRYSPRLEKLLYLAGDNEYERFDLTGKAVGLIAVQNAYSLNSEFKTELLPGGCGRHRRYAT